MDNTNHQARFRSSPPNLLQLSKSRSLEVLSLAHNGITGSLPQALGNLTRLKLLNISNNKLTGESSVDTAVF